MNFIIPHTTYMGLIVPLQGVFANCRVNLGPIQGYAIPKTLKTVLDASLLNTQHYKVQFKGKVEQYRERSKTLPYISL